MRKCFLLVIVPVVLAPIFRAIRMHQQIQAVSIGFFIVFIPDFEVFDLGVCKL